MWPFFGVISGYLDAEIWQKLVKQADMGSRIPMRSCSIINLLLKFKSYTIFSFRNRIQISIDDEKQVNDLISMYHVIQIN